MTYIITAGIVILGLVYAYAIFNVKCRSCGERMKLIHISNPIGFNVTRFITVSPIKTNIPIKMKYSYQCPKCGAKRERGIWS